VCVCVYMYVYVCMNNNNNKFDILYEHTHKHAHITHSKHKPTKRKSSKQHKRFSRSMYTYIIDLEELDVRYTKDLKFLHAYSEPSLLILHETG